jgi:error-prone DNA polymerase
MVVCRQRPGTAKGFVFLLIEDETGLANVVIQPQLYEAKRSTVRGAAYVLVKGRVQLRSGTLNLLADDIEPLAIALTGGSPQPPLRNGQPGNPHDVREQAATRAAELAAPPSHDFH